MTYFRTCSRLLLMIVAVVAVCPVAHSAQKEPLTAEWVYGEQGSHIADVPLHVWLDDATAILYDTRIPEDRRTL